MNSFPSETSLIRLVMGGNMEALKMACCFVFLRDFSIWSGASPAPKYTYFSGMRWRWFPHVVYFVLFSTASCCSSLHRVALFKAWNACSACCDWTMARWECPIKFKTTVCIKISARLRVKCHVVFLGFTVPLRNIPLCLVMACCASPSSPTPLTLCVIEKANLRLPAKPWWLLCSQVHWQVQILSQSFTRSPVGQMDHQQENSIHCSVFFMVRCLWLSPDSLYVLIKL